MPVSGTEKGVRMLASPSLPRTSSLCYLHFCTSVSCLHMSFPSRSGLTLDIPQFLGLSLWGAGELCAVHEPLRLRKEIPGQTVPWQKLKVIAPGANIQLKGDPLELHGTVQEES